MDTFEKRLIGFAIIAISVLSILIVLAPNHSAYAPGSRRWPVTTGMNLPLVNILDENVPAIVLEDAQ